jgi:hypothetical protein
VVSFLQVSPLKPCMHLSFPPHVLHVLPISVFLIWSPEWYLVRSTELTCSLAHSPVTPSLLRLLCNYDKDWRHVRKKKNWRSACSIFSMNLDHKRYTRRVGVFVSRVAGFLNAKELNVVTSASATPPVKHKNTVVGDRWWTIITTNRDQRGVITSE